MKILAIWYLDVTVLNFPTGGCCRLLYQS